MAGQEAHVYKYADRSQLFYQCQISITIKEPNSECQRPQCTEPQGFGAIKTRNGVAAASRQAAAFRVLKKRDVRDENIVDVRTDLNTLDINEEFGSLPNALRHRSLSSLSEHENGHPVIVATMNQGICMSVTGFTFAGMLTFIIFAIATIVAVTLLRSNSTKA
ncbi:cuticlin 1 [Loa loa]|nr:cuticlin 1 [Loa loa]EFO12536.1 cuticlin 1 [Loa loa]